MRVITWLRSMATGVVRIGPAVNVYLLMNIRDRGMVPQFHHWMRLADPTIRAAVLVNVLELQIPG